MLVNGKVLNNKASAFYSRTGQENTLYGQWKVKEIGTGNFNS
jgi:hypothetical protein